VLFAVFALVGVAGAWPGHFSGQLRG